MSFKDWVYRFVPLNSATKDKRYIGIKDYQDDLDRINRELRLVDDTIEYYKLHRKVLNHSKNLIEEKIGYWNESDTCSNCRFFSNLYCSKFESDVNPNATCQSFEWKTD